MNDDAAPRQVLGDLPVPLWGELLRAVRRVGDSVDIAELPTVLRPFARWHPDRLVAERPREAVAAALVEDARFRTAVAEMLDAEAVSDEADPARLAAGVGEERAAALLASRGRWQDLAVLAADASDRLAAEGRAAAEASRTAELQSLRAAAARVSRELSEARQERDAARRRAEAAEEQARRAAGDARERARRVDELEAEIAQLRAAGSDERKRSERRQARLRRRLADAESRARVDAQRVGDIAARLAGLAEDLREAVHPEPESESEQSAFPSPSRTENVPPERAAAIPRDVGPAVPGRPCRLPPGVAHETTAAVRALLQTSGLRVIVDGYNVTKDERGRPRAELADQRRWLQRVGSLVVARYRRRVVVVFDGNEPGVCPPAPRDVTVLFTSGDETADERIVALVENLPPAAPVLVVTSDREIRDDVAALGADVVSSATFLAALDR